MKNPLNYNKGNLKYETKGIIENYLWAVNMFI